MSSLPDAIVIGAGMVGVSCALRLAEEGLQVTIVEHAFAGGGSTGAAMGHIVVMDDSDAQRDLCAWSRRRLHEWVADGPPDAEHDTCGTLWLAVDDDELATARSRAAAYRVAGVSCEVIDELTLRGLEPNLRPGLAGALLVNDDAVCYPPAIARALLDRASMRGVRIVQARVTEVGAGRVTLHGGEVLAAGAVVVAAGAASGGLIPGLPVVPRKGHLVITERRPGLVRHQLVELGYLRSAHTMGGASVAFNVQPRRNGQLLIGSSRELVGFDAGINHSLVRLMVERAMHVIPAVRDLRAYRAWTGFRPATPDSLPLIGRWTPIPGVWIASGHEGLGITMAVGTADLIAAMITGAPPPVAVGAFDPCRSMPSLGAAA